VSERLQKFLARSGVSSRRHAEGLITAGRVTVNNERVTELGTKVEPTDLVTVDGALVTAPESTSWYLLHKPPGVVTTLSDPEGRPTVAELLGGVGQRVFPVGRLDWDAEGALLVTNDGEIAHRLLHPSFEVPRTYLAKVKGTPTDETLARLRDGVRLEDGDARALRADRFEVAEKNTWLVLQVGEGRPHLVKRLCAAVGHPVVRLFRPAQAGISVAGLQSGDLRPLTPEEIAHVQAVAAGKDVGEPALFLPPRRHGRAGVDEDIEPEVEGSAPKRRDKGGAGGGGRATRSAGAGDAGAERGGARPPRVGRSDGEGGGGRGRPAWGGAAGDRKGGAPVRGFQRAGGKFEGGAAASQRGPRSGAPRSRAGFGGTGGARGPRSGPPGSRQGYGASGGDAGRGPPSGPQRSRGFEPGAAGAERGPRSGPPRSRGGFGGAPGDAGRDRVVRGPSRGPRTGPPRSRDDFGGAGGARGPRSGPPRSRGGFGGTPGDAGRDRVARGPRTGPPPSRDGFSGAPRGEARGPRTRAGERPGRSGHGRPERRGAPDGGFERGGPRRFGPGGGAGPRGSATGRDGSLGRGAPRPGASGGGGRPWGTGGPGRPQGAGPRGRSFDGPGGGPGRGRAPGGKGRFGRRPGPGGSRGGGGGGRGGKPPR